MKLLSELPSRSLQPDHTTYGIALSCLGGAWPVALQLLEHLDSPGELGWDEVIFRTAQDVFSTAPLEEALRLYRRGVDLKLVPGVNQVTDLHGLPAETALVLLSATLLEFAMRPEDEEILVIHGIHGPEKPGEAILRSMVPDFFASLPIQAAAVDGNPGRLKVSGRSLHHWARDSWKDLLVVGAGVLGRRVAKLWRQEMPQAKVVAATLTEAHHGELREEGLEPILASDLDKSRRFAQVVFCAPPSRSSDYGAAVAEALAALAEGGMAVFTSSASVFAEDGGQRSGSSAQRMLSAEAAVAGKGAVLRLAGLYDLDRGPHSYWLKVGVVKGAPAGLINLVHYDDAASAVVKALQAKIREVFVVADGQPLSRREICEAAVASKRYGEKATMPRFEEREQHGHWSGESRCNLLANAVESYLDVMVLPISLVLLLTPWRFASFHTEGLRQSLVQAKDFHRKLSKLRNWAFCASFSAVVDVPFIAIGLSSLVLPVRLNSLWSILFVKKGFENPKSDCEARGYLCMLPLLTLTDLLAFILGMLAFVNPWRTCTLIKSCHSSWNSSSWVEVSGVSPRFQEATRWNAQLRWMAMKIGLASLMDLLLLPLVLVLTLTFYRAKPVWMELCGDVPSDLDLLPLSKAHRVILKQFGLFLLDIVTLPCLILVLCTWYRYRHMRHKQEQLRQRSESTKRPVAEVICSSSLLLSVYRLPKLYRLLTAEVDEALTRDTYDWDLRGKIWEEISLVSRMVFFLASKSFCARRRVVLCQFLELLRDTLGFGALLILVATLVRLPKVLLDIYSQRARQVSGEPRLTLRRVRLVSPDAALQADGRLSVQVEGQQLEQYQDLLNAEVFFELKMGGRELKTKLMQLNAQMAMCVQLEHRTPKGTDEILARLPLPTRFLQEAVRSPGTFVEVPEELLHASAEEVCGPLLCGSGIRNALTPEQLQRVVKQQQAKSPVISLKAHRWAELQANESTAHFVDRATAYSSLLDAEASYWPGLILGTNLQLTQECINPHEHALALEKIMAAQALAEEISSKLAREVQAACDELNTEEHKGVSVCRGLCSKSLQEQRHLVRVFVLDMLKDYGCLFLALMLLLSLYRIPAVCNGLFRPSKSRFRERLRVVLNFQMRCLVRDLWMLISTFLCSLAALITLVRALEFLQSAFLYCKNLADLREAALKSTAEAFNSMWELFMLLTLWETYGTLVRATICAVLIPAWGLRCLPHWLRIVFWLSLTALPWLLSFQHALWSYGIILLLFFLLGLWKDGAAARPTPAYLKTLRVTSVNALILLSIVAEPVLLTALVVGVGVSESSATPSTRRLLQSEGSFAAAAAVTLCWLIVMSLPHVMSSESSCLGTVRFHVAMQFLRRACLPAAVVFLAQDGSRGAVSLLLLGFLSFTTILGLDLLSQRHLPDTVNLDLVQPAAFLAGSIFTQVIFVYQLLNGPPMDVVAQCGQQLVEAVCTPPSSLQIFLLMKRKSGRRIPTAIWQMILEFVSDVRYMSKILDPVVKHFNGGTPHRQLLRAYEAMKGVGSRVHNVSLARRCASEPLTPKTVSMARPGIPLEVWCEASGASSASGSRTGAWRRRVLQKVHKSGVTVAKEPGESSASHVFYDFKTCSVRFLQLSLEEPRFRFLFGWRRH
eukprot:g28066.t1